MDAQIGYRLINLRERIVANFKAGNWTELGLLTGHTKIIEGHSRLLRSLDWGDEDYAGNVLDVLKSMVERQPAALAAIESYMYKKFPAEGEYVSAKPAERKITFAPSVFQIPEGGVENDLVSVMMPFASNFGGVFKAIKKACTDCDLRCLRADDIWEDATIMQDVFSLIFRAQIVVVDFSGKNPNVMYETGIAHTLGKHVIPITQSLADLPSDMSHHRVQTYLNNTEGLTALRQELVKRLRFVSGKTGDQGKAGEASKEDVPY